MKFRPWGSIDWLLSLSPEKSWGFVGCLGTEERSLCSWSYLKSLDCLNNVVFSQIRDIDSVKYGNASRAAIHCRRDEFIKQGGDLDSVHEYCLMSELFQIMSFANKANSVGSSIVLDITSFPKRFLFPILKKLVVSTAVKDLVITYTAPSEYAPVGDPLYENIEPWKTLPGFGGRTDPYDQLVVSIGFMVESLNKFIDSNPDGRLKLLVPFPAPLSIQKRTWTSVFNLEKEFADGFLKYRVETLDMSTAFDRILSIAGNPARSLGFAPFGPKPTSVAICLYAMQQNSPVYYPQPIHYHPGYSKGIRYNDAASAISAYWVKHDGENLYTI